MNAQKVDEIEKNLPEVASLSPKLEAHSSLLSRLMSAKSFRLGLLVAIAFFELGFVCFINYFGWLDSVDIGTQVLVFATAFLPLVIAALVMARRRFKLSSVFIAFTMLCVFMTFSLRPVWDARNARSSAKRLQELGVEFRPFFGLDLDRDTPARTNFEPKSELPDWIARLLGKDIAALPVSYEIISVSLTSNEQLEGLVEEGARLTHLRSVFFTDMVRDLAIQVNADKILSLPCDHMIFGGYNVPCEYDLNWLQRSRHVKSLTYINCPLVPQQLIDSDIPSIERLTLGNTLPAATPNVDWKAFFAAKTVVSLRMLHLQGMKMDNSEAQEMENLESIEWLSLVQGEITNFKFVEGLPNLRVLEIQCDTVTIGEFQGLKFPETLRQLNLVLSKTTNPDESPGGLREQLPAGCELNLSFH